MELHERINSIHSKEHLAEFIAALRADLNVNFDTWENPTLDRFLDAMERWVGDMQHYYENTGQPLREPHGWKVFADILYAAKVYE